MIMEKKELRVIVSGGGTGGHIFPAVAIANEIMARFPDAHILFVGAEGRMEMEKVPAAGYKIIGLPVSGFDRHNLLRNVKVLWRLCRSLAQARKIVKDFHPDIVVGVGGYASGPTLWAATAQGIPALIQEQNGFAGVTNKMLARRVEAVCVAYDGMERFFPADKIVMTGNPVRQDLCKSEVTREEALCFFDLDPSKKTLLVIGGSLGARTINRSIADGVGELAARNIQLIWQTGKGYDAEAKALLATRTDVAGVRQMPFISRMDMAYKAADLVVSRAGASSISELCLLEKPAIFVPSPNVAEDHQTKNAQALSSRGAALLVPDAEAPTVLIKQVIEMIDSPEKLARMAQAAGSMAQHDSAARIVDVLCKILNISDR